MFFINRLPSNNSEISGSWYLMDASPSIPRNRPPSAPGILNYLSSSLLSLIWKKSTPGRPLLKTESQDLANFSWKAEQITKEPELASMRILENYDESTKKSTYLLEEAKLEESRLKERRLEEEKKIKLINTIEEFYKTLPKQRSKKPNSPREKCELRKKCKLDKDKVYGHLYAMLENTINENLRKVDLRNNDKQVTLLKRIPNKNNYTVSLEIDKDGHPIALINHKIGSGNFKCVKAAVRVDSMQLFARMTGPYFKDTALYTPESYKIRMELLEKEVEMLRLFEGVEEIVQMLYSHVYYSENKGYEKQAIMMEFCNEGDLKNYLIRIKKNRTSIEEKELVYIFLDVLSGLEKMEARGVLHQDLKTDNVLLIRGEDGKIRGKIGDFGFASFEVDENKKLQDGKATCVGTFLYFSPEYLLRPIIFNTHSTVEKRYKDTTKEIQLLKEQVTNVSELLDLGISFDTVQAESKMGELEILRENLEKCRIQVKNAPLPKKDLWAFGLIIYEALYGVHLYQELFSDLNKNKTKIRCQDDLLITIASLTQEKLNQKSSKKPSGPFEEKMQILLKAIFVLDPLKRPNAAQLLQMYKLIFNDIISQ